MANTNTKKPEDEVVPGLPDMSTINKDAVNTASANLSAARGALNNMSYDTFKQGALYDGLKKSYEQQGRTAMKDTLGQVAARTGGMASSYATSAANQSYNNYMQTLEDAARAMYNDEYSKARDKVDLAQQGYNNAYGEYRDNVGDAWNMYNAEYDSYWDTKNYNYQVGRDTKADNDAAKEDEINTLSTDAYYGKAGSWQEYLAAHPNTQLSESDYNSIVGAATGKRADENRTNVDAEFESMFGAEGFDWDNYDWNGDGKVDETDSADAYDFSGSSYGADYWQQYWKDAQQGYADADTKAAQDEVIEILKAGGTPDITLLQNAGWLTGEVKDDNKDGIPDEIPSGLTGAARTLWQNNIDSKTEADTKEAQGLVADIWATGGNPSDQELYNAGYMTKNEDDTYSWTTAGISAYATATGMKDGDLEQLFLGKGFNWNTWKTKLDTDKDGTAGEPEDVSLFFTNSDRGGEAYWKNWYDGQMSDREETAKTEAQGRVSDAWSMGQDVSENDLIDAGYIEVNGDGKAITDENGEYTWTAEGNMANARRASGTCIGIWENGGVPSDDDLKAAGYMNEDSELTTLGEQAFDSYFKPQISQSEAMNNMLNTGVLNTQGQAAFDYYFGSGAYTEITDFAKDNDLDLSQWSKETYTKLGEAAENFLVSNPWANDLIYAMLTEYEGKRPKSNLGELR